MRLGVIVEGHGEVAAAPILLRRVAEYLRPGSWLDIALARSSDSFDKLVRDLARMLGVEAPPRGKSGG